MVIGKVRLVFGPFSMPLNNKHKLASVHTHTYIETGRRPKNKNESMNTLKFEDKMTKTKEKHYL